MREFLLPIVNFHTHGAGQCKLVSGKQAAVQHALPKVAGTFKIDIQKICCGRQKFQHFGIEQRKHEAMPMYVDLTGDNAVGRASGCGKQVQLGRNVLVSVCIEGRIHLFVDSANKHPLTT